MNGNGWDLFAALTYTLLHNENLSSFEKYLRLIVNWSVGPDLSLLWLIGWMGST